MNYQTLKLQFLRHLSRCSTLLHVLDIASSSQDAIMSDYEQVLLEMARFDKALVSKPRLLLLNKMDLLSDQDKKDRMQWVDSVLKTSVFSKPLKILQVSALEKEGTDLVLAELQSMLDGSDDF